MDTFHKFVLLTLVCSVGAAPSSNPPSTCQTFTDSFESFGDSLVPGLVATGTVNGTTYQGFSVSTNGILTGNTNGVIPHSGQNDVTAAFFGDIVAFNDVTLNPFGNLVAEPTKFFDLISFFFGCGLYNANPQLPGTPVGCVIAVTGFDMSGNQIPVATFSFAPTNPKGSSMNLATLPPTFKKLRNVTFGVASGSSTSATTLLDLDDVKHCNYS